MPFRRVGQKYAFVVVAVIFLSLLVSAGLRSSPGVLLVPLEEAFGWSRSTISFAAAMGIFLYGLVGPFAAAAMERFGPRRVLIGALALMSASSAASAFMTQPWHLLMTWACSRASVRARSPWCWAPPSSTAGSPATVAS